MSRVWCTNVRNGRRLLRDYTGTPEELPVGIRFAPTDVELLEHLAVRIGSPLLRTLPPIDGFMQTIEEEGGFGYTHPENLPGAKKDGSAAHFFHQWMNEGRVINDGEVEMVWRQIEPTVGILDKNGSHVGFKTIMVFDEMGENEGSRWVAHQYHLVPNPNEDDGHFVVSKVFYRKRDGDANQLNERELIDENAMQNVADELEDVELGVAHLQIGVQESLNVETAPANLEDELKEEIDIVGEDGAPVQLDDDEEDLNNIPSDTGNIDTPIAHAMDNI